jgi:predicted PurR-regulated permease PerM
MDGSFIQKYFFSALLVVAIIIGFILFWPFLKLIILAIVFSVLLHPLYRRIHTVAKYPSLASFLTIVCFILIICIPTFFVGMLVIRQFQNMYLWLTQHGSLDMFIRTTNLHLHRAFPEINFSLQDKLSELINTITSQVGAFFTTTLTMLVSFILMLLSMFYFLKDGSAWKEALIELSPLSFESNSAIVVSLKNTISGIFKGYFVVGLAQGITTAVGFFLFHIPHPVLWGLIAAFGSLVPTIGSSLIAVPAIAFLFFTGKTGASIGYTVWAVGLSMMIDNVLNPYVVGRQIAIHPLLVLFSVLGGITLMGPIGIIVGPLIISLIYTLISVYKMEMAEEVIS